MSNSNNRQNVMYKKVLKTKTFRKEVYIIQTLLDKYNKQPVVKDSSG